MEYDFSAEETIETAEKIGFTADMGEKYKITMKSK